jgi:hypothetical protein
MAMTTTYFWPNQGSTPPTAAQMNQPGGSDTLIQAQVNFLDTDTQGTFIHNMGFAAGGTDISANFPLISITPASENSTFASAIAVNYPSQPNSIVLSKPSLTGSGGTFNVTVMRPHTLIR